MADDFCKIYEKFIKVNGLSPKRDRRKREYHREPRLSDAEVMTIMILFHFSGYKCLKHFYSDYVCAHMRHLFPTPVSYNRFTELERKVSVPMVLFPKKCLMGRCTGISFVDSTALRVCRNQRIHLHRVFRGAGAERAMLNGVVLRLQAAPGLQREGGAAQLHADPGQRG